MYTSLKVFADRVFEPPVPVVRMPMHVSVMVFPDTVLLIPPNAVSRWMPDDAEATIVFLVIEFPSRLMKLYERSSMRRDMPSCTSITASFSIVNVTFFNCSSNCGVARLSAATAEVYWFAGANRLPLRQEFGAIRGLFG